MNGKKIDVGNLDYHDVRKIEGTYYGNLDYHFTIDVLGRDAEGIHVMVNVPRGKFDCERTDYDRESGVLKVFYDNGDRILPYSGLESRMNEFHLPHGTTEIQIYDLD